MRWASLSTAGGQRIERQLGVEQLLNTGADGAPVVARDGEMAAVVEQGALADLGAATLGSGRGGR